MCKILTEIITTDEVPTRFGELIAKGDVYIIRNNQPQYVVLSQERYQTLLEAQEDAYEARVRASLEDLKAGRVKRGTAEDLIRELKLED